MTTEFFRNNRRTLLARLPNDALVVIAANGLMQRSGDTAYRFRQDSNFLYLTGLEDVADAVLFFDHQNEYLILRDKSKVEIIFEGGYNNRNIQDISGIKHILSETEGRAVLKKLLKVRKKVHTITAPRYIVENFYVNPARAKLQRLLKRLKPGIELEDLRLDLARMRQIKQPAEVSALKQAIAITGQGFKEVRSQIAGFKSEQSVQAVFDRVFTENGSQHGYTPIVAYGNNATVLHYASNNQLIGKDQMILMDIGAEVDGYSADISRTYSTGKMSARQKSVYEAVRNVHEAAQAALRPGLKFSDWFRAVEKAMGEELLKLNLITVNRAEEVRRYFPHSVSHSLGLDVHDSCTYETIEENMVLTVEPGLYIPEESIGVRIEDNVLMTKSGAYNLSTSIPTSMIK